MGQVLWLSHALINPLFPKPLQLLWSLLVLAVHHPGTKTTSLTHLLVKFLESGKNLYHVPRVIGQPKKVLRRKRGNALLGRVRVLGQAPRSAAEMGIWVHVTNWGSTLRTEGEWRKLERAETGVKQRCGVSRTLVRPDPMGSSGSVSSTTEWALSWGRDWPFVAIAISYDSRLHPEGEC